MQTVKMSEIIDALSRFLRFVLSRWKLGVLLIALGAGGAVIYYFAQKPEYEGRVSFILEEKSGGMGAGLSGLASQFGIDIGGLSGGSGMFNGDNILDILVSRSIVEKVLLTKVDTTLGDKSATLADRYLTISGLRSKLEKKGVGAISYQNLGIETKHSLIQDSVLYVIYERLVKKHIGADRLNKKGSVIVITTRSTDAVFSKVFPERLLEETRNLYVQVKTGISAASVANLEKRADSLLRIVNAKSYQSASMQVLDANAAFKTAAVPAEVTQRDRTVAYAIYSEVMKNLEASKMALANQTPVIQLLDVAKFPLANQNKGLFKLMIFGIIAGVFVFGLWMFLTFPKQRING